MDYLPNVSRVRNDLQEKIEVYFSRVKRETKSINVCAYDADYSIAWIVICEKEGTDSPLTRIEQKYNFKRFRGKVLTISLVELGRVVGGHVDRRANVAISPRAARTSTPKSRPLPSRTYLLREVVPIIIPPSRVLKKKQIRYVALEEKLCFICLRPDHIRTECPKDPKHSSKLDRRVFEATETGLQIKVPNRASRDQPNTSRSFDNESWDDPPPKCPKTSVLPQSIRPMPLMSLHSGSLKTFVATEPAISELRATALSSRSQLNVPTQFSSKTNGSFEEGSAVVSLSSSSKPKALSFTCLSEQLAFVN